MVGVEGETKETARERERDRVTEREGVKDGIVWHTQTRPPANTCIVPCLSLLILY